MEAMGFAEMVAETKVLKRRARDAHVELGPMDFGKGPKGPEPDLVLSIWATMIPRYSFPAAQQAQISENLLAYPRNP